MKKFKIYKRNHLYTIEN